MIRHVLCPIDVSEESCRSVDHATAIARWLDARLTGLHVSVPIFMPIPGLPPPMDRVSEAERDHARDRLMKAFGPATDGGLDVDIVVDVGSPAVRILERAASLPADIVVMGTHGAGGFEHFILGSVAEKVLRKATCPVLTVPPGARSNSLAPFERVMCAVDFSDWSVAALELASLLAKDSASLTLLHAIEWPWREPPPPTFAELPREQAQALAEYRCYLETDAFVRLESLVPRAIRDRLGITLRVRHGKAYAEILRCASEEQIDLIIIGVHGRNPLDVAFFGSTAYQVVRRASCPVLTLRR